MKIVTDPYSGERIMSETQKQVFRRSSVSSVPSAKIESIVTKSEARMNGPVSGEIEKHNNKMSEMVRTLDQ